MIVTVEAVEYEIVIRREERTVATLGKPHAEVVIKRAQKGADGAPGPKGEPGSSANDDPGDLTLWFNSALIG